MTQISDVAMLRRAQQKFAESQYDDADMLCMELLKRNPKHYQALSILLEIASNRGLRSKAMEYGRRLVKAYPKDAGACAKLVELYHRAGRFTEAITILERFAKSAPNDPIILAALARAYDLAGNPQQGIDLLEPIINGRGETPLIAYRYATILLERKQYERVVEVASRHLHSTAMTPDILEAMSFMLGRAFESLGEFDKSFAAYSVANSVFSVQSRFEQTLEEHQRVIDAFSKQWVHRLPRAKTPSRLPVFIACRPRSGSTLVERIIAAHPKVHASGEHDILKQLGEQANLIIGSTSPYPECMHDMDKIDVEEMSGRFLSQLTSLAPKAERITNKNMGTWQYAGLLALICPNAAIIDLRRDAVDNCLGIFTSHLYASRGITSDLRQIGLIHRQYERVMDHWHSVLDTPILRVNYEDIVADQETWSRRIIEFCGLEWDDQCLRFYEKDSQKSSSANPTLSHHQVRQPIYKSSVARARKFEKHLGPLYEALELPYPPSASKTEIDSPDHG